MSGRNGRRRSREAVEDPSINLTPLIDVVFVVLIMFIVLAPLLELDNVALANAHRGAPKESIRVQDEHPISIHVKSDSTIWFNKQLVTPDVLEGLLKQAKARHPGALPLIFQDRRSEFGSYQSVKNAVEAAGFVEMNVVLEPA